MPHPFVFYVALNLIVASGAITLTIYGLSRFLTRDTQRGQVLAILAGASLMGMTAGFHAANSRIGVMGDVLPAILAVLGGISIYLFGVDRSKGVFASLAALTFAFSFSVGSTIASPNRNFGELSRKFAGMCMERFSDASLNANRDAFCRFHLLLGEQCLDAVHSSTEYLLVYPDNSSQIERADLLRRKWLALVDEARCPTAVPLLE